MQRWSSVKKTYITTMPDKAGAFLEASSVIAAEGGNIVRVNYNKAVTLATFLRNKRMMVLENRAYTYKPDFYY